MQHSHGHTTQARHGIPPQFKLCFSPSSFLLNSEAFPLFSSLFSCLSVLSLSHTDSSEVQVLLHETPAVALIEGRYGGTKATGGRACPLSLLLSTGLTFRNCKLQKLARAKCLTLFDLQPYGGGREGR